MGNYFKPVKKRSSQSSCKVFCYLGRRASSVEDLYKLATLTIVHEKCVSSDQSSRAWSIGVSNPLDEEGSLG